MVKKIIIISVFFLFLPLILTAETIFIYTISEGSDATLKSFVPHLEDGVMDELFNAGNIVFNASSVKPVKQRGLDTYKEPEDLLTAKSGGASFLLEIAMHYTLENGKEIPQTADYRLFKVSSGKILNIGKIRIEKDTAGKKKSSEKKLEDMGRTMVQKVLRFL